MVSSALDRLKYVYYSSPSLDNCIFKLCYQWTVLLLVTFSFVITSRLLLGDSFTCLAGEFSELPSHYLNTKCYAEGVYIRPAEQLIVKKEDDDSSAIDPSVKSLKRYQSYYPWVNLFLLLQAFNFYLPHVLWQSHEGGYLGRLTAGVQTYFDKEEKRGLELCYLAKYFLTTQGKHTLYTSVYVFFESCNFAVALAQTLMLVYFFHVTGVPEDLPLKIETWLEFENFYFPSTAVCAFEFRNGKRHSALCELPLNSVYMKMFLYLHAWYIILTVLCGLLLLYRVALLAPSSRLFVIKSRSSLAERSVLESLCRRMSYGDWFFLSRLQKAMTDIDFAEMIDKIAILSQGNKAEHNKNADKRLSFFEDGIRDFESSDETTAV